jgi:post-segregation antitoxin (ccd killing protein)
MTVPEGHRFEATQALRQVLNRALAWGLLDYNPAKLARAEGISVSDAVREAIAEHIARKRKDKAFRERLHAVMERDREILERLAR